jgi:hypothetical protein
MIVKASARSILVLATGVFVCLACPSQAATGSDEAAARSRSSTVGAPAALRKNLRHGWRHKRSYAHRRSHKIALKTSAERKADVADAAGEYEAMLDIPPSVANAKAQLQSGGTPAAETAAMPTRAYDLPQDPAEAKADNGTIIVAADQLNDVDRALREGAPSAPASATPAANPPPAPGASANRNRSTWDQTSLIGKVFIGFGALLTVASAARMFIA